MRRFFGVFLLFGGLVSAAGCNSSSSTPTTPSSPAATSITQVLTGTIAADTKPFHSFTVPNSAPLHMMLGSLTNPSEVPLGATVTFVYGVTATDGTTCQALQKVSTKAGLRAQINVLASAGEYCLTLEDLGSVPVGSLYAIRVIFGTPSEDTTDGSITYSSSVLAGGSTARSFPAANDGIGAVAMDAISPASVGSLGVAVGFQRNDGSGCHISLAFNAPRGFLTTYPIDAGRYCVKVFDPGTLTETTGFTIRINHP